MNQLNVKENLAIEDYVVSRILRLLEQISTRKSLKSNVDETIKLKAKNWTRNVHFLSGSSDLDETHLSHKICSVSQIYNYSLIFCLQRHKFIRMCLKCRFTSKELNLGHQEPEQIQIFLAPKIWVLIAKPYIPGMPAFLKNSNLTT